MITKVELKNWKSFAHSTLHIDPLTFVIGVNASGKSNLLDAFSCLSKLAHGRHIDDIIENIRGGKDWLIRLGQTKASLCVTVKHNSDTIAYLIELENLNNKINIAHEELKQNENLLIETSYLNADDTTITARCYTIENKKPKFFSLKRDVATLSMIEILDVAEQIKEAAYIMVQTLRNIFILNPIPNNMRGFTPLWRELKEDASNIAGVLAGLLIERKNIIEQELSNLLKHLPEYEIKRVWAETVGRFNSDAMLYCEEQWMPGQKPTIIDARGMSDGTLRFMAIATALLTMLPNSLLIVEEIDNGLHPSRAKELVTMLKELSQQKQVDVLCTTHNPVLLDELGTDMLPFISYIKRDVQTGGSHVELLEEKENLAKLMAQHTMGGLMVEDCL